ncbi:MAG: hypothetical protein Q7S23_04255 [bacterium]|nr:hypothetical protein [bacterium]
MGRFYAMSHRTGGGGATVLALPSFNPRVWCTLAVGGLLFALASYLVQANNLAAKGYQMQSLRDQLDQLRLETRDLESRALELQSFQNLEQRVTSLQLVPANDVRYVSAVGPVGYAPAGGAGY